MRPFTEEELELIEEERAEEARCPGHPLNQPLCASCAAVVEARSAPLGYVPSADEFQQMSEEMAAETGHHAELAIVDGTVVRGRLKGRRFVMAPEEAERMAETKRERRRDNDQNPGVERLPKGLI